MRIISGKKKNLISSNSSNHGEKMRVISKLASAPLILRYCLEASLTNMALTFVVAVTRLGTVIWAAD